ncbi:MAG: tetratricopeptide repeat protein [Myxococcales bacterium]|nr:tetratricopeptide repeat protein [Myxococcales bacterium]MCB9708422.1 tetratricopeptide repeat protein [Myxococcales bacterium]
MSKRRVELAMCLVFLSACGGGGGPADTSSTPRDGITAGGEGRVARLQRLNSQARERWGKAIAEFQQNEREGWSNTKCSRVSDGFENAAEAQKDGFPEAWFMAGLSLERCGETSDALALYERALRTSATYCKARVALGVIELNRGNTSEAMKIFRQSIKDDARCTEGYVNLATMERASARTKAQYEEVLANLRRGLAIDANYLPAFNQMALLYLSLAGGDPKLLDLAEVVCRQAQQINKNYAPIYNTWGLINLKQDKIIEAAAKFRQAFELDNGLFPAHMNFGQITLSFRGYEDARKAFEQATKLEPNNYDAHIGLGVAWRGLKSPTKAEAEYLKALEIDKSRPEALFNLGVLYQDYKSGSVKDYERAKDYFESFLSRAAGGRYSESVEEVRRRCHTDTGSRRRKRPNKACRPGRLQNIELALQGLREGGQGQ